MDNTGQKNLGSSVGYRLENPKGRETRVHVRERKVRLKLDRTESNGKVQRGHSDKRT